MWAYHCSLAHLLARACSFHAQALRKAAQASAELRHEAADMATRINKAIKDGRMVYTTAVGKSAAVASRLAASLSSIGIPARVCWPMKCAWYHVFAYTCCSSFSLYTLWSGCMVT